MTAGQAIADAAGKMKEALAALAAERLNCAPSDVRMGADGSFSAVGTTSTSSRSMRLGRDPAARRRSAPRARTPATQH